MMIFGHLLATLLLGLLISKIRPFSARDWAFAIGFSVVIDLDHLLQFPRYVATQGWSALAPGAILQWGSSWQGFMHEWWAVFLVLAACALFRSWIPITFWLLHMFQDFVIATRFIRFGSMVEWGITLALALGVMTVLLLEHRRAHAPPSLGRFALARLGLTGVLARR